jgi:hypothetical protein
MIRAPERGGPLLTLAFVTSGWSRERNYGRGVPALARPSCRYASTQNPGFVLLFLLYRGNGREAEHLLVRVVEAWFCATLIRRNSSGLVEIC